jgi:hypothetical protein
MTNHNPTTGFIAVGRVGIGSQGLVARLNLEGLGAGGVRWSFDFATTGFHGCFSRDMGTMTFGLILDDFFCLGA